MITIDTDNLRASEETAANSIAAMIEDLGQFRAAALKAEAKLKEIEALSEAFKMLGETELKSSIIANRLDGILKTK